MDTYEATNILLSKIKNIDPENASKIMGYILIQGHSDNDLLSLALASYSLLHSVILKAKTHLGLSPNVLSTPSAPFSPSPLNPISRPGNNHNPFSQSSPRVTSFVDFAKNPSPHFRPVSEMVANSNGTTSASPKSSPFLTYDDIRAGSALVPPSPSNGGNGSGDGSNNSCDLINEYQLDEYFSFLDDFPPRGEEILDPRVQLGGFNVDNVDTHLHRRRFSESDVCFGVEDGSFGHGFRPCMYFARGFCKNGDNCKFVHGGFGGDYIPEVTGGVLVGSPREMEGLYLQQREEMMRMKAVQQQRLAYNKYMNFLMQQESDSGRMGAASVLMGDEIHKFGQFHPERNDFLAMAMEEKANSASRQIYLTFPADSTFKDEDVSNYFSTFGPVQDVRIPYQQKRMFGFVTFVHPETVKLILLRGNPHFICDSRVLVKPYKEKGKVANKRQHIQQQLVDRGNLSPCSSPSGLDPRELYDLHLGVRMLYNTHEVMLRRKLEQQAELQQAIELQGRRMINLQLPDLRGDFIHHHHRSLSAGSPISLSPCAPVDHNLNLTSDVKNQGVFEDKGDSSATTVASTVTVGDQNLQHDRDAVCIQSNGKVESFNLEGCGGNEDCGSLVEHGLPDSPFASPRKSLGNQSDFSPGLAEVKESTESSAAPSSEISAHCFF